MNRRELLVKCLVGCTCSLLLGAGTELQSTSEAAAIAGALLGLPLPESGTRGIGLAAKPSTLTLNVQFELNSARLKGGASEQLDLLWAALVRPEITGKWVEISGHTDSLGSDTYNLKLSSKRAAAVRDYLLGKGGDLSADRMVAVGMGEQQPIDTANSQSARNRRVEVRLIPPQGG